MAGPLTNWGGALGEAPLSTGLRELSLPYLPPKLKPWRDVEKAVTLNTIVVCVTYFTLFIHPQKYLT